MESPDIVNKGHVFLDRVQQAVSLSGNTPAQYSSDSERILRPQNLRKTYFSGSTRTKQIVKCTNFKIVLIFFFDRGLQPF